MELKLIIPDDKVSDLLKSIISPQNHYQPQVETAALDPYDDKITSIEGLAAFIDASITTAQKLKNSGKIRYRQFGRKVIFLKSEVMEDLEKISFKRKNR